MSLRNILLLAIVLLGFSYATTTVILLTVGIPTGPANFAIKGTIMLMFLIALVAHRHVNARSYHWAIPLVIFLAIYSVRMMYDILVDDIVFTGQSVTYIVGYFFGLTVLPALTTAIRFDVRDIDRLHNWILIALVFANVAVWAFTLLGGQVSADTSLLTRAQVAGDEEGTTVLNPITISLMGAMLAVFAMGRLLVIKTDSLFVQSMLMGVVVLGSFNVLLGGSRGPVLSFLVCAVLIFIAMIRSPLSVTGLRVRPVMWIYGGVGVAALIAFLIAQGDQLYLFDRFRDTFESRSQGGLEERDFLVQLALADFERAPFFGDSYVMSAGGFHPHNLVIEVLMATGGFGMMFFGSAIFLAARGGWRMLNGSVGPYGFSIALMAVMMSTSSLLSGSVGQYPELWLFLVLITVIGNQRPVSTLNAEPRPPAQHMTA